MIKIPYSPNYEKNAQRRNDDKDALPCAVCGKQVSKPRWWVHVHMGGSHIVTDEEAAGLDPAADMYFFPLGSDCLRKHPELKAYAHKITDYDPGDDNSYLLYAGAHS